MNWLQKIKNNLKSITSSVQILEPPVLFDQTQSIIASVMEYYGNVDFISYWGAYNSAITSNDVIVFNNIIANKQSDELLLFIKSSGGSGKVSLRLIHLLRKTYRKITVLVPMECASAATMLALGADCIKMGPLSYLTAIDTSITHDLSPLDKDNDQVSVNQNELDRVLKLWNKEKGHLAKNPYKELYKYIHPLVFGSVDRASSLSIMLTNEILSYHMNDEARINKISNHLNAEYPAHGYPITAKAAKYLGLNIEPLEEEVNDFLIELSSLYSEKAQRAYTDYSEFKFHDNQVFTIIETPNKQIYYQKNLDQIWRKEDQTWVIANDKSSWVKIENGVKSVFYIR